MVWRSLYRRQKGGKYFNKPLEAQSCTRPEPFELASLPVEPSKGTTVNGTGFLLSVEEASDLLAKAPDNAEVIKRYLNGAELNNSADGIGPRFIIDFGDLNEEQAARYEAPWRLVEMRVAPGRGAHRLQVHEKDFWKFQINVQNFMMRYGRSIEQCWCPQPRSCLRPARVPA